MQPTPQPPNAVAVDVVATQPTDADRAAISYLGTTTDELIPPITYLVMVRLDPIPPATSMGWALYLDDFRVPKYWEYKDGVYFKVYGPQFFRDHQGKRLRFSANHTEFIDTGLVLDQATVAALPTDAAELPRQEEVLGIARPAS
jgi:hypothetical protein